MRFNRIACKKPLLLSTLIVLIAAIAAPGVSIGQKEKSPSDASGPEIPESKQTTLGLYVTAGEAFAKWKADPENVKILDVRTIEEFIFIGHAEMAWNIPFAVQTHEWDSEKKHFAMKPDPDFVSRVKAVFTPDDVLLVTCRSGGRSAMSVNLLAEAGFKNVYNIIDGMEGDMVEDPGNIFHGKRMKNGWKNSGSPWTYDISPERVVLPEVQ
jgi:rhodanese-related sulfurtransferase